MQEIEDERVAGSEFELANAAKFLSQRTSMSAEAFSDRRIECAVANEGLAVGGGDTLAKHAVVERGASCARRAGFNAVVALVECAEPGRSDGGGRLGAGIREIGASTIAERGGCGAGIACVADLHRGSIAGWMFPSARGKQSSGGLTW